MKEQKRTQIHTGRSDSKRLPGCNACRIHLDWDIGAPYVPWQNGNFNPAFMPWLKKQVEAANAKGMTAVIVLEGTPNLRLPNFDKHALNAKNGGVIDLAGKRSAVTQYYRSNKVMEIIEQLLYGISGKLHGLNIEIFVMWETFIAWNYGGLDYNYNVMKHWINIDNRRIGTGNAYCHQARQLRDVIMINSWGRPPRFYVEAWNYRKWKKENADYLSHPANPELDIQFVGCWPHPVLFWENRKNTAERQAYFTPGMERANCIMQLIDVVKMFLAGVGPCGHFQKFTQSSYWKEKYKVDTGAYDFWLHQKIVNDFFTLGAVQAAVKSPELLKTKTGRKRFIAACQEYKRKLLRS